MGQSPTTPLTMKTAILAACVLALATGQRFQSFPSGGAQPVGQQPQFVFRPQQQVLAQQQQRPSPQQQFRQPAIPQAAPQQSRQPANTQALQQQFRQPQGAPQQFRQPQAAPQQFRQPVIPQAQPQQFQPAIPQSAPQQFRQPQAPQPSQQQFRQPAQCQPARQPQPQPQFSPQIPAGSATNDALGNLQIDSEQYVHDPSGDATLSRFQQFQLKKKQEAGR